MKKQTNSRTSLEHEFVESFPDRMEEGKIYVSIEFALVGHKCCCGCGYEVITPISPAEWQLTFDGESISLHPSIGNWSFDCQSHYWIKNNKVHWSDLWSRDEIDRLRAYERQTEAAYYGRPEPVTTGRSEPPASAPKSEHIFARFFNWLRTKLSRKV